MEKNIQSRLREKSLADLKVIQDYSLEKSKTDPAWEEKYQWVSQIIEWKILYIFE